MPRISAKCKIWKDIEVAKITLEAKKTKIIQNRILSINTYIINTYKNINY